MQGRDDLRIQSIIMEFVKKIGALELELKQKDNQYENVCRERYMFQRNLQEAKEEISNLKSKYKDIIQTLELIRNDTKEKSVQLVEQIAERGKAEQEVENLEEKLNKVQENLQHFKRDVEKELREEFGLKKIISERDDENRMLKREIEQLKKEQDVIKNKLFLKDDEISSLLKNVNELENTILKNKADYNQKVEEIRLIGTEMKNLSVNEKYFRKEKAELVQTVNESNYLKKIICNLEEDILQEKVKSKTFEEELTNPLNFHRWRKLQAADPEIYELIQKIHFLQKRSLKMAREVVEQEEQLKEVRELNSNLQKKMENLPQKEFHLQLHELKNSLRQQKLKNKVRPDDALG
ncbi:hypothetical protein J437_LFUL016531 [Ladona fulva]|uniref:Cilia- and flagella-associated protein 58 central coiled coil domain-containing protein n=1 Tax=Ladona fulva TaxID=123851 RepID=A0A8K0P8J8_LADFU|nr:hypothetical protein J437_LFUL016531 [Ladona fulva]